MLFRFFLGIDGWGWWFRGDGIGGSSCWLPKLIIGSSGDFQGEKRVFWLTWQGLLGSLKVGLGEELFLVEWSLIFSRTSLIGYECYETIGLPGILFNEKSLPLSLSIDGLPSPKLASSKLASSKLLTSSSPTLQSSSSSSWTENFYL